MPASALELRPRTAIQLFDAAIRLCARQSGIWALTLPGGAAVTGAAIAFGDALREQRHGWAPALWLTAAWFFRALCQGAASHFVEQQLVGQDEPTLASSALAALRRLPSLFIAVMVLAAVNAVTIGATFGLGYFFFSSHLVGYAAAMQGKGRPLSLYATCGQLLGAARGTASRVRACLLAQGVLMLNVHLGANLGLRLGQKLIGLELTFAERYASLDNPAWVLAVAAFSLALVEPVRAALAALLILDGRVRQEGLDLLAAIERLPPPKGRAGPAGLRPAARAGVALLAAGAALWSAPAAAGAAPPSSRLRLQQIVRTCQAEAEAEGLGPRLEAAERVRGPQRAALDRFLDQVESRVDELEDCEGATALLRGGLEQIDEATRSPEAGGQPAGAADRARDILQRPEFREPPPRKAPEAPEKPRPPGEESAWTRFWRQVGRWLDALLRPRERAPVADVALDPATGVAFSGAMTALLTGAVLAVAALVLLRWRRSAPAGDGTPGLEVAAAGEEGAPAQESALSRPPEGWASLADLLAARGEYREAVRSLYLAALSRLHREGALDYDPALSNWDHVRRFKGPPPWKPPFRELTLRFDYVVYGNTGGTLDGYRELRALSRPLLEAAAPGATA